MAETCTPLRTHDDETGFAIDCLSKDLRAGVPPLHDDLAREVSLAGPMNRLSSASCSVMSRSFCINGGVPSGPNGPVTSKTGAFAAHAAPSRERRTTGSGQRRR